jgi:predicted DCC family thiol-disulfide oxidoreductase YuxK
MPLPAAGVAVIYDGDCPLCAAYTRRIRLAAAAGEVHLIDARQDPDLRRQLALEGLDLDQGMVVAVDGLRFHGARAMHILALMSTASGAFNRLNYLMFRSPRVARAVYPLLVAGRRLLLAMLGRQALDNLPPPSPNRS